MPYNRPLTYAKGILWRPSLHEALPEVLVLTRSLDDDHRPGDTDLPGGRIRLEEGELIEPGFMRELRTETGLTLAHFVRPLLPVFANTITDSRRLDPTDPDSPTIPVRVSHIVLKGE